ncbi:unnamed protein product [Closterium sp. Yama58-4]|nr:unnamed protein product [Closterium sp. Yama58-4]
MPFRVATAMPKRAPCVSFRDAMSPCLTLSAAPPRPRSMCSLWPGSPSPLRACVERVCSVLANNRFEGKVPFQWGQLQDLETLDLSSNNISGTIPLSLAHCTRLQTLGRCSAVQQRHGAPPRIEQRRACAHGQVELCTCDNGAQGQRACLDGTGFTACMCPTGEMRGVGKGSERWRVGERLGAVTADGGSGDRAGGVGSSALATAAAIARRLAGPTATHLTMRQFTLDELSRATNAFHADSLLATHGTCRSFTGHLPPSLLSASASASSSASSAAAPSTAAATQGEGSEGTAIVIKEVEGSDGETAAAFAAAVEVFAFVRCPHLVEVLGCCCTPLPAPAAAAAAAAGGAAGGVVGGVNGGSGSGAGRGAKVLVYEMAPNGTLDMHLHDLEASMSPLPWSTRMAICLDVAKGLAYLHAMTPQMTHAALTTGSVALDGAMRAKLADYCLPLLLSHPRSPAATAGAGSANRGAAASAHSASVNMAVAAGTAAPELAWLTEATPRVDVYAFGVLLLEVISGRRPLDATRPPNEQSLVHWAKARLTQRSLVERMVDPLIARAISTPALYQVAVLASQCIHSDPDMRPTMLHAVEVLSRVQSLPLDAGTPHSAHHLPTVFKRTSEDRTHKP